MSNPTLQVDGYIRKNKAWSAPLQALREVVLSTGLTEDVKWRVPCYTLDDANVVFLGAFKDACTLSFVKGVLLKDPKKLLRAPGPDTQSARLIRFTTEAEVAKLAPALKAYIKEAIAVEKSGAKVKLKSIEDRPVPEELEAQFKSNPALKTAFGSLTPGRQRLYLMHFSAPKQTQTRVSRIQKAIPLIMAGKGLSDDYVKAGKQRKKSG